MYHGPPLTRAHERVRGQQETPLSLPPFNGGGPGLSSGHISSSVIFRFQMGSPGGAAGFVLESKSTIFRNLRTKNWLQLRCVHPIGAGVGDRALLLQEICRTARASSELKLIVPHPSARSAMRLVRGFLTITWDYVQCPQPPAPVGRHGKLD